MFFLWIFLIITFIKATLYTTVCMESTLHKLVCVKAQHLCVRLYIIFLLHKSKYRTFINIQWLIVFLLLLNSHNLPVEYLLFRQTISNTSLKFCAKLHIIIYKTGL